jgi:endonuclease YncB( thermonuclease family)
MSATRCRAAAVVVLAAACVGATSAEIPGVVVSVQTGDRVVLYTGKQHLKVRLAEVTAPPAQSPLGARARESLAGLCHGEAATLIITGTAEDGVTVGQLSCGGRDIAAEQVRRGLAEVKKPFDRDSLLRAAENDARAARAGMWGR